MIFDFVPQSSVDFPAPLIHLGSSHDPPNRVDWIYWLEIVVILTGRSIYRNFIKNISKYRPRCRHGKEVLECLLTTTIYGLHNSVCSVCLSMQDIC